MTGGRELDFTTKIIVIVLVVVLSYLILFSVLSVVFPASNPMDDGFMGGMMDGGMMGGSSNGLITSLVALSVALVAGALVALLVKTERRETTMATAAPVPAKVDELEIIKRVLSDDEKAVVDEVRRAGEITQDSLRFRLDWSKAKLSRILTNLDRLNIIQRERLGKTYNVFLTGKRPER
jgi:uncharacterized membrane protein